MRTSTVTVLIAELMFAAISEEALIFALGRHLFSGRSVAAHLTVQDDKVALATSVRGAEAAERRACLILRPLDLYDPRTSCEAR